VFESMSNAATLSSTLSSVKYKFEEPSVRLSVSKLDKLDTVPVTLPVKLPINVEAKIESEPTDQ
tara:strand:- start:951 stop:1142 length:192 start_codon:yes stop_codon:yes gene_type:complete